MAGKWHLGPTEELSPAARGFDNSWVLVQGGTSHFDDGRAIVGVDPKAIFLEDGKQVEVPEGFFSSDFYADKFIEHIDAAKDKPFFSFLAFTAPHWPLHAPEFYINKYQGRYGEGYEAIRQQRVAKMREMGLIGDELSANVPFDELPTWNELTDEQRKMEVYAAMVDNMDHNIGRPDSYIWYGAQWVQVSATPYPMWKAYPSQGGLLVPAILSLPGKSGGEINHEFFHVMDVMPTFLELAGIEQPASPYNGREIFDIQGVSMLPGLNGKAKRNRVVGWELLGPAAVRKGDWKIRLLKQPT